MALSQWKTTAWVGHWRNLAAVLLLAACTITTPPEPTIRPTLEIRPTAAPTVGEATPAASPSAPGAGVVFELVLTVPVGAQDRTAAVWSPDSAWLAVGGAAQITLFDTHTWQAARSLPSEAPHPAEEGFAYGPRLVVFSPDARWLATVTTGYALQLWDVESGALQQTFTGHTGQVLSLLFSADGTRLASAAHVQYAGSGPGRPGEVRVWSVESGELLAAYDPGPETGLTLLGWVGSELLLQRNVFNSCSRGSAGWITALPAAGLGTPPAAPAWEQAYGSAVGARMGPGASVIVTITPATCVGPSGLAILDGHTGQQQMLMDTGVAVCAMAVGGRLETLVAGTCTGELVFLTAASAPAEKPAIFMADGVYGLAYGADDAILAASGSNQTSVWRVSSWQHLATFDLETAAVAGGYPFSPDGRWLVTNSPEQGMLTNLGGEIRVRAVAGGW